MHARTRVLKILLALIEKPFYFSRKDLSDKFEVSKKTINDDIKAIKDAEIKYHQDDFNRCAILPDSHLKELKSLMAFNLEERQVVTDLMDKHKKSSEANKLKRKFRSLFDFQKLGLQALRRPELQKIDTLEQAKERKTRVILEHYKSNSNQIKNRIVEPFLIDTEQNTLQAFDIEANEIRHFRINRIERVQPTQIIWQFEKKHRHKSIDVFRIAQDEQVQVHLELDVYSHNYLVENFHKSKSDINHGSAPDTFDFQSNVNKDFIGVTNFILANRGHVKILGPDELKIHIKLEAQKIIDQIDEDE